MNGTSSSDEAQVTRLTAWRNNDHNYLRRIPLAGENVVRLKPECECFGVVSMSTVVC